MDPITIATTLEMASRFLKRIGGNREAEIAYYNLITELEQSNVISSALQNQLKRYQIERDELIGFLRDHKVNVIKDTEISDATQKLILAMEEATETNHAGNLKLIQLAYSQHLNEQKVWLRFTIAVSFLGFLLIFAGIASIYVVNITTGIAVTAAGIAINLASALFARQATGAASQANNKYEKLDELEDIRLSAEILSYITTGPSSLATDTSQ